MSEAGRPAPSPEISPELQAMNAQNAQTFQDALQKVVATESEKLKQPYMDALDKVGSSFGEDEAGKAKRELHEGINTEFEGLVDAKVQAEIEDRLDTGRWVGLDAVPAQRDFREKTATPEPASPATDGSEPTPGEPESVGGHTVTDRRVATRMAAEEAAAAAVSPEPATPEPTPAPEPGSPEPEEPTPAETPEPTPVPGEPEPTPAPAEAEPAPASPEPSDEPAPTPATGEPATPAPTPSPEPGTPEPGEPADDPESKWETGLDAQLRVSIAPVQEKVDAALAAARDAKAAGDDDTYKAKAQEANKHLDHIEMLTRERDLLRPSQVVQDRFDDAIDNIEDSRDDAATLLVHAKNARHLQAVTASQERWSDRRIRRERAKLERFIEGEQTRRERARAKLSIEWDLLKASKPNTLSEAARRLGPRRILGLRAMGATAVVLETTPEEGDDTTPPAPGTPTAG